MDTDRSLLFRLLGADPKEGNCVRTGESCATGALPGISYGAPKCTFGLASLLFRFSLPLSPWPAAARHRFMANIFAYGRYHHLESSLWGFSERGDAFNDRSIRRSRT